MNPYDEKKLGDQAILDFSQIRKKTADTNLSTKKEQTGSDDKVTAKVSASKEEMRAKVNMAKIHATKEINQFRKIISNTKQEMEKLCIFKDVGDVVEGICEKYILEMVLEPIIKGNIPQGMSEDMFREIRSDIYCQLIATYVDDEKK